MLSVVILASEPKPLAGLLARLTSGAVDGLVRQVIVAAPIREGLVDELCEETGADWAPSLNEAFVRTNSDWLLVVPADFRLRAGWIAALRDHLMSRRGAGLVRGETSDSLLAFLRARPFGVLVEATRARRVGEADLQGLRRELGSAAGWLG